MSQLLIQNYLNNLQDLRKVSGTHRESVVREAFKDLLKNWGKSFDLIFIPEYEIETPAKERRYVDGALVHELRVPFGYWEAKDEQDDLEAEIELKFSRGYPKDNIVFEDTREAVLYQNRQEVMRSPVDDVERLKKLLNLFFSYQRPEIADFRKAVEQFKIDLPAVLKALRDMIEKAQKENAGFKKAANEFLKHAKDAINPSLTAADVREILIQHILTEEVFSAVFPGTPFHQDNNVAKELYNLEHTFFVGNTKYKTLQALEPYYAAIRSAAAQISSHHEKQTFLKVIYENFYKVYNTKAADRLGVVYTPNEIVKFMIEGADWLCHKHFKKSLIDKDVDILDPASGTGTYVCELLEHFRGQQDKLKHKYLKELHANEVAILPYYVANLNIEATYASITGNYEEYPNLCFVDTLDNTFALRKRIGDQMGDLFGSVSEENVGRIRRQNSRTISVVIGNPPYNANQLNENENNKNRPYPEIDKRIKETYIKKSTAQKSKVYDMYARFFRWASDRVDENGILVFITNRSFIDSKTFDGFRKDLADEFKEVWVVDLGGDVRANPKLSGTKHNVFGIQTGVAISFLVKKSPPKKAKKKDHVCKVHYSRRPEFETSDEKLSYLLNNNLADINFKEIDPDSKGNWLNLSDSDFEELLTVASKNVKFAKKRSQERAIFKLFSLGAATNRDDWLYDYDKSNLLAKVRFFTEKYNSEVDRWKNNKSDIDVSDFVDREIKWTSELEKLLTKGEYLHPSDSKIINSNFRPFCKKYLYFDKHITHRTYQLNSLFIGEKNPTITFLCVASSNPITALMVDEVFDLGFLKRGNGGTQCLPLYRYDEEGTKIENITDWGLNKFINHYKSEGLKPKDITKADIFYYIYAILHDPIYIEKYEKELKRDFPNIPLYKSFKVWSDWGRQLSEIHVSFELVEKFSLQRVDKEDAKASKVKLKVDKENGTIEIDAQTTLTGIPAIVWEYNLGNRSAIEWVIDQFKEKKPRDPTVREKFNSYRFSDYKEHVIDLLQRVTTVSVETIKIVNAMREIERE